MILKMISLHRALISKAAQVGVRNLHTSNALRKNLYETLGLTRDATQADIKNAYFELSKMFHPDKIAATDENLAKFREITHAYEVLGNEQSRRLYDRGLVGDLKRPGVDETQEIVDPIIKFYKQRQEAPRPKAGESLDALTAEYYRQAKAAKKAQFYTVSQRERLKKDMPFNDFLFMGIFLFGAFLYLSNYRGTAAEKMWNCWFGSDKKLH